MKIEKKILQHLLFDEDYTRKVLPFLTPEYFREKGDQLVFELIAKFVATYNKCPSIDAISIEMEKRKDVHQNTIIEAKQTLAAVETTTGELADKWLIDTTEQFCQKEALYRAIAIGASVVEGGNPNKVDPATLPKLLQQALAVSFDTNNGHDYMAGFEERWEYYHKIENKIPFDIDMLNLVTKNGVSKKTLNVFLASTGVGKTMLMCHMAAANLARGLNVLYVTLEISEYEIAKRIDVNLLDMPFEMIDEVDKTKFMAKAAKLRASMKGTGRLKIKEYSPRGANANTIRHLLHELKTKENFVPDIIYMDYLNLLAPMTKAMDSYTQVKVIAEDVRSIAIDYDLPVISATQSNRSGFNNSDIDLDNTSESWGLPGTVDFMMALIWDADLADQIMCKQLKSRYGNKDVNNRFMIGFDRSYQRLYNLERSAQKTLMPDINVNNNGAKDKPKGGLFDDFK